MLAFWALENCPQFPVLPVPMPGIWVAVLCPLPLWYRLASEVSHLPSISLQPGMPWARPTLPPWAAGARPAHPGLPSRVSVEMASSEPAQPEREGFHGDAGSSTAQPEQISAEMP